jgi:hypothetical protein
LPATAEAKPPNLARRAILPEGTFRSLRFSVIEKWLGWAC